MKQKKEKSSILIIFKRLLSYIKNYKWLVIIYLGISILLNLINIFFANTINKFIDAAIKLNSQSFQKSAIETGIAVLAGIILSFLSAYVYGVFSSKIMLDIRNTGISHLQKLSATFIENSHTGDLISRFTGDMNSLQSFLGQDLFQIIVQLLSLLLASAYLININFKLYFFSLILLPLVLYLSTHVSKPMGKYWKEASANVGKANSIAQDSYGGIFIVKAFNLEDHFLKRFTGYTKNSFEYGIKALHRLKWMPPFNIFIYSSPFTICLIYGAFLSINKEISPGQLPAFVYLLNSIVWPLSSLPRVISNLRSSMGTAERFFEVLDKPAERQDGGYYDINNSPECIYFHGVSFSYNAGDSKTDLLQSKNPEKAYNGLVLEDCCFQLIKGQRIGLVGESGCGKSTVLKLIQGFYPVSCGTIRVFGEEIDNWKLSGLRENISYVSQEAFLFPESIRDNIGYGKPGAAFEEIREAAISAGAHEFIMELPEGYETMIGERGVKLSGGQRQRISLARAFLKNAPLILLDEPTSALDNISEAIVISAINNIMKGKTAVIVTHKLSAIKDVDIIYVMEDGKIIESGSHEELISREGRYKKLYQSQINEKDVELVG